MYQPELWPTGHSRFEDHVLHDYQHSTNFSLYVPLTMTSGMVIICLCVADYDVWDVTHTCPCSNNLLAHELPSFHLHPCFPILLRLYSFKSNVSRNTEFWTSVFLIGSYLKIINGVCAFISHLSQYETMVLFSIRLYTNQHTINLEM